MAHCYKPKIKTLRKCINIDLNFRKPGVVPEKHPERNNSHSNDVSESVTGNVAVLATLAAAAAGIPIGGDTGNPDEELAEATHREISMSTDSCLASMSDATSASSCSSPSGGGSHHSAESTSAEDSFGTSSKSSIF